MNKVDFLSLIIESVWFACVEERELITSNSAIKESLLSLWRKRSAARPEPHQTKQNNSIPANQQQIPFNASFHLFFDFGFIDCLVVNVEINKLL